jgi:hypothetical protein
VDAPLGIDSDSTSSEPPSQVGLLAQLMRHNQEMARQHSAAIGSLVHHMSKMIEKLSDQNEKYMSDRITMFTTMEDLTSRRHEREIETEKAHASIERNKEIFQKIAAFLPIIANKVVGQPLMHQKFSEFEATALQFIETLTPTKLDAISGSSNWSQDQLLLLGTMLEQSTKMLATADEKKERADTAKNAVFNGLVPGGSG